MICSRIAFRIFIGALFAGVLVAGVVAFPQWVSDSRMVLEVRFKELSQGSQDPVFKLRYDKGRGWNSLRVVEPYSVKTEDPDLFRWKFDARPIETIQIGIANWRGPLEVESAVLSDQFDQQLYEFDIATIQSEGGLVSYPAEDVGSGIYYKLALPVSTQDKVERIHRFSGESLKGVIIGFLLGAGAFWVALQLCRQCPLGWRWVGCFRTQYPVSGSLNLPSRRLVYSSLSVLTLFVFIRSWENFLYPSLPMEDSFHYFNYFYDNRIPFLAGISRNPNGYLNILPNFIGWVFSFLDVRRVASAYVGFALAFTLFASLLPLATGLFRNRWIVFVVPLVLGLSGMNHIFYYTTLTFQMYVAILVLLGILFLPAPRTKGGLILRILIGVLLVFSGPYSVVAVPACLLLLVFFHPTKQSIFWAVMVYSGVLFLETSTGMVRLQNAIEPMVLQSMADVMVDRVLFFDWFEIGILPGLVSVGVLVGVCFFLLRKDAVFIRIGTIFLAIAVLAMAPLFLSVKFLQYSDPYDCHVLISQFFWLLFLLVAADRIADRVGGNVPLAPIFAGVFLAFVGIDQVKNPQKGYFPPNPEIQHFLDKVYAAEQLSLQDRNESVFLEGSGATQDAFEVRVRVGSSKPDAREVIPEDLPRP